MKRIQTIIAFSLMSILSAQVVASDAKISLAQQLRYKLVCKDIDTTYMMFDKNIRAHFENYNRILINVGQGQLISEQDIATVKSYNDAFNKACQNLLEKLKLKIINIDEVGHNLNQITDHIILTLSQNVSILELLRERLSAAIVIPCFKNEDVRGLLSVLCIQLEHIKAILKVRNTDSSHANVS